MGQRWVVMLLTLAALMVLATACQDEDPAIDDPEGPDPLDDADDEQEAGDEDADDEGAGDESAEAEGACVLLDPDGLHHYFDVEEHALVGPTESDEGYPACQWEASGEGLTGRVYTATILDWDDPRFEGLTGQEGFDAFVENRLEEDGTATFLERYGDDVDVDALELVDDLAYTNELYVLNGDEVYRLEGDPRGAPQSGRLVDDGHFPAARP